MIKFFCDSCGVEIDRKNQFEHKELKVGEQLGQLSWLGDPVDEKAALCKYCVIDEVNKLDDRPQVIDDFRHE